MVLASTAARVTLRPFIYGVSGRISYYNPDMCDNDATTAATSSAWSMVTAPSATYPNDPSHQGYAQSGYLDAGPASGYQAGVTTFSQYLRKCAVDNAGYCGSEVGFNTAYWVGPSGTWSYASQYEVNNDRLIHMYAHGYQLDETNYDPLGDWQNAWQCQFFGETHDNATGMPGTAATHVNVDNLIKKDSNLANSFVGVTTFVTANDVRYRLARYTPAGGGQGFQIWTDPLR